MPPDDIRLPNLSNLRFGLPPIEWRLEKILYVVDPPSLLKIDERVRHAIINEKIEFEIKAAELEIQRLQGEVAAMRNVQKQLMR